MSTREQRIEPTFMLKQLIELSDALQIRQVSGKLPQVSSSHIGSEGKVDTTCSDIGLELAARRAGGESYAAIAIDLNRRGLRGRYGGRWYTSSVRALLQRGRAKKGRD